MAPLQVVENCAMMLGALSCRRLFSIIARFLRELTEVPQASAAQPRMLTSAIIPQIQSQDLTCQRALLSTERASIPAPCGCRSGQPAGAAALGFAHSTAGAASDVPQHEACEAAPHHRR